MRDTMTLAAFDSALESGPYAWPGGYPLFFLMTDGAALSFAAAVTMAETIRDSIRTDSRDGWRPAAVYVNWEDSSLYCDHTGARIESAYGDDDDATPGPAPVAFNVNGAGFKGARIAAEPAGLVGVYVDGIPYQPDRGAVRAVLPYHWRASWDRCTGFWWNDERTQAFAHLADRRGRPLTTVYANATTESGQ